MGFSPREVARCSLWEFSCAYAGWLTAQGVASESEPPTEEEHEALIASFLQAQQKAEQHE